MISQSKDYLNNNLENTYVNKCSRLRDSLQAIPQELFEVHIRYLDNKISEWSNMYPNYNSYSDYVNNLYNSLKGEVDAMNNSIYNVPTFSYEHNRLLRRCSDDNANAAAYFGKS
jgi:hypothetical protein